VDKLEEKYNDLNADMLVLRDFGTDTIKQL
jgi:hypothetical protein